MLVEQRGRDLYGSLECSMKASLDKGGWAVGILMRTRDSTPNTCFPRSVRSRGMGPTSHLPPLGTHSPPNARPMI